MADGQGDVAGTEADPLPGEERSDLEEGGELEEEEEEDVDGLASFLESEILSGSDAGDPLDQQEEEKGEQVEGDASKNKRKQDSLSDGDGGDGGSGGEGEQNKRLRRGEMRGKAKGKAVAPQIDTGVFSYIPPELFLQVFKFLSSEDLISCALVCRFMNVAASDETLWYRLYCIRWGLAPNFKLTECAWKTLYILQDREEYPYRFRGVLYPDAGCKKESSAPSVRTRAYMLGYNCTDEKELEDALRFC